MKNNTENNAVEKTVAAIFALDLEPIKFKLMSKEEGYGWSKAKADHYEQEYKRFLALVVKYPEESIAPSVNVDKFWHAHILDTMKYADDCEKVFGYFLHHYPYFGLRGEEDAANQVKAAEMMRRLYEQEFGAVEAANAAYCGAAVAENRSQASAYCGVAADKPAAEATAYCGRATGKATEKQGEAAAYCGVAAEATAYCGATAKTVGKGEASAYCGAAAGKRAEKQGESAAYCGVAAGKPATRNETTAAYCGAVAAKCEEAAAYCGAATHA